MKQMKAEDNMECKQTLGVDSCQLRTITKVDPLTIGWEIAKQLSVKDSVVILNLKQIGEVKRINKHVSWIELQSELSFWMLFIPYSTQC